MAFPKESFSSAAVSGILHSVAEQHACQTTRSKTDTPRGASGWVPSLVGGSAAPYPSLPGPGRICSLYSQASESYVDSEHMARLCAAGPGLLGGCPVRSVHATLAPPSARVSQGDPLSPALFAMLCSVLDPGLQAVSPNIRALSKRHEHNRN